MNLSEVSFFAERTFDRRVREQGIYSLLVEQGSKRYSSISALDVYRMGQRYAFISSFDLIT